MKYLMFLLVATCHGSPKKVLHRDAAIKEVTKSCTLTDKPLLVGNQCCGVDSSANVTDGGKSLRQYPWLALVEYRHKIKNNIGTKCGGILITGKHVLSAAHCFNKDLLGDYEPANVRLGEYDIVTDGPDCISLPNGWRTCTEGAVTIPIEKVTVHPQYFTAITGHDIALIKLKNLATYTDYIRTICLPTTDVTAKLTSASKNLIAAGWGKTATSFSNVRRDVQLPYMPLQDCLRNWNAQPLFRLIKMNETSQLCAGGVQGVDVCRGDSGGPLMYQSGGTYEALGVVSYGWTEPCGKADIPAVFTKVFAYKDWINSNL